MFLFYTEYLARRGSHPRLSQWRTAALGNRAQSSWAHILSSNLDESTELIRIARTLNKQFNALFVRFGNIPSVELQKTLFNSFCSSYYGIEIVDPANVTVAAKKFFSKSVNISLMKLLKLPRESVSPYLIAEGLYNADTVWGHRSLMFWRNLEKCPVVPGRELILHLNLSVRVLWARFYSLPEDTLSEVALRSVRDAVINNWMDRKLE